MSMPVLDNLGAMPDRQRALINYRHLANNYDSTCVRIEVLRRDAVLLSYTHDVLQSPAAIERLLAITKPSARFVLLGMKTLPWLWGWPVNVFNLYRARRYLTTYTNIGRPWAALEARGAKIEIIQTSLWGGAYIATATFNSSATLDVHPAH